MPTYVKAHVYDEQGTHRGYVVLKDEANKLHSLSLWDENELPEFQEVLNHLNDSVAISDHWPSLNDPDVQSLLDDATFQPVEMHSVDHVDEARSIYAFQANTELYDEEASTLVTYPVMEPVRPADVTARVRAAREKIARQRARI